jgi:hypothetical protein
LPLGHVVELGNITSTIYVPVLSFALMAFATHPRLRLNSNARCERGVVVRGNGHEGSLAFTSELVP